MYYELHVLWLLCTYFCSFIVYHFVSYKHIVSDESCAYYNSCKYNTSASKIKYHYLYKSGAINLSQTCTIFKLYLKCEGSLLLLFAIAKVFTNFTRLLNSTHYNTNAHLFLEETAKLQALRSSCADPADVRVPPQMWSGARRRMLCAGRKNQRRDDFNVRQKMATGWKARTLWAPLD